MGMMSKWVVLVLVAARLGPSDSRDSCVTDSGPGTCRQLSQCSYLVSKIEAAGHPMPMHLRRKLQSLSCGFEAEEPLVCCSGGHSSAATESNHHHSWNPTHGSSGDSHWHNSGGSDYEEGGNSPDFNTPKPTKPARPDVSAHSNVNTPPDISRHRNLKLLPSRNCGVVDSDRIWGGNRTRLFEMPWMVLVAYDSSRGTKLSCGGTLISERYVLTAAHCVTFLGSKLKLTGIVLGEYDVRKDPDCERVEGELNCAPNVRNVTIERVIAHPGYSPQNLYDDIALVRLAEPADFTLDSMKPICLPMTSQLQSENLVGVNGIVAGWGATEDGLQSPVLLSVDLPIVSNEDCQNSYNGSPKITVRQLCAGGVQDKDSCGGDSGGPLVYPGHMGNNGVRYVQRGIVSFGSKRCGIGGFPGVYTRVAFYMDWILDNISP